VGKRKRAVDKGIKRRKNQQKTEAVCDERKKDIKSTKPISKFN
jgi:hypothetical protein